MSVENKFLPRISIVTPSFNQGEFLEECIDSVLGQNYPNLEYVIMDGGSTDNSVEIIKKYEKYLAYWQSKPDGGQYAAINDGFSKTTGEIMAWLNSDDKYHDRSFYVVACLFATQQHAEWVTGRPTFWDKNGDLAEIYDYLPTYCRSDFLDKKYNDPFIQQESTFWRRALWERAGGRVRADLGYAGDLELWVRFFRLTELYTIDALLSGYRGHGNQKAALSMDRYVEEAEKVLAEESDLVNGEAKPRMQPAPEPITISPRSMNVYFRNACPSPNRLQCSSYQVSQYMQRQLSDARAIINSSLPSDPAIDHGIHSCGMEQQIFTEQLRRCEASLAAIESSRFWRLTKPLRIVADWVRSL